MKFKLDYQTLLKRLGSTALKLRGFIIAIAVIGLLGYTGYLASRLVDLQPDQAYLSDQRSKLDQSKVNFDKKTIQTINNLQQVNPPIDLSNVGKSDPFSP